jgi:hypothetical protein
MPFAVCTTTTWLRPNGPWRVWDKNSIIANCLVPLWNGLVNLDNWPNPTCATYQAWLGPPVNGPPPTVGATIQLDPRDCDEIGRPWAQPLEGTTQMIPEIGTLLGLLGARVMGCRLVVTHVTGSRVEVTPPGVRTGCGNQQIY